MVEIPCVMNKLPEITFLRVIWSISVYRYCFRESRNVHDQYVGGTHRRDRQDNRIVFDNSLISGREAGTYPEVKRADPKYASEASRV